MEQEKKGLSNIGFITSALAGAVGLGNIWGFPTQMYQNGGAVFLIPFFIAIFFCGLPILILEINLGNKWRKSHIKIFEEFAGVSGRFFGWLQSAVVWIMAAFYSLLVAWTLISLVISFVPEWLNQPDFFEQFFSVSQEQIVNHFWDLGRINWYILLAYVVVWLIVLIIVSLGVTNGIAKANNFFMVGLLIMLIFMVIYSSTLTGAGLGLENLFQPKLQKLLELKTWTSAFASGFFTLSICSAAIIIFSGYAPKRQDNANQAYIIVFGDVFIAIIATMIIFSGIGNIAKTENKPFEQVFSSGDYSLVFKVFPKIFAQLNLTNFGLGNFLGIVFFLAIFFAGLSSLIMATEAITSPLHLDLRISRIKATLSAGFGAMGLGFIFVFKNSALLIPGIATWSGGLWQLIIGLFECLGIYFIWKKIKIICNHNNNHSWIKLKRFFKLTLGFITPTIISLNLIASLIQLVNNIIEKPFIFGFIGLSFGVIILLLITFLLTFWFEIKKVLAMLFKRREVT